LVEQMTTVLARVNRLSEIWPKTATGERVPLEEAAQDEAFVQEVMAAIQSVNGQLAEATDRLRTALEGSDNGGKRCAPRKGDPALRLLQDAMRIAERFNAAGPLEGLLKLPNILPQQTAPEVKAAAMGIADGPKLRRWEPIDGEIAPDSVEDLHHERDARAWACTKGKSTLANMPAKPTGPCAIKSPVPLPN
jgi:hypothetical protein